MATINSLRPAASAIRNCIKTPYVFPSCLTSAPYTTAASAPALRSQHQARNSNSIIFRSTSSARPCAARKPGLQALTTTRSASTSSPSAPPPATKAAPATSSPANASAQQPTETLTWNRYLALRKTRRLIGLIASGITAAGGTAAGAWLLATQNLDAIGAQTLGLDPLIVMVIGAFSCGGIGWLVGPTLGNGVFALVYRRLGRQIADKEREFYARLKKYRVDPTSSSLSNPVPDYYGEKIGSVANYRRWLKDQRAFNLKVSGKPRVSKPL